VEHFANKLSLEGKTVLLEDFSDDHYELYQMAKVARVTLDDLLGWEKAEGDWILQSATGEIIPQEIIDKIREGNPKTRILIATTTRKQRVYRFLLRMPASRNSSFPKWRNMRSKNPSSATSK
jgi:hypothetical protein